MAMNRNAMIVLWAVLIVIAVGLAYNILNTPERRTPGQKVGDAIDAMDDGVDNAARELKDRTPAQRLRDNVKDATDND